MTWRACEGEAVVRCFGTCDEWWNACALCAGRCGGLLKYLLALIVWGYPGYTGYEERLRFGRSKPLRGLSFRDCQLPGPIPEAGSDGSSRDLHGR